jgi:7,8-dihydroneopterin aldolase/epimerase/oxygenase
VDQIRLTGLTVTGVHGVLPEEKGRAQPFRVDAELEVDLAPAGASDSLADTVDYGALALALAGIVREERHLLLERLATRLVEACLADRRVMGATVEVTKLRPPVPEMLEAASVRLTRRR